MISQGEGSSGASSGAGSGAVAAGVNVQTADERRRALAATLRRPLIVADETTASTFPLIRRHASWLREWFARHCGWTLIVDSGMARLRKTPADTGDATRCLRDAKDEPFTRRRYVLLCLALAALERSERQTVLRKVAEEVTAMFASEPRFTQCGVTFDLKLQEHRRDLIAVIRHLQELKVLARVDGDEQKYITQQQDVLYGINPAALAAVLNVRRGPSTIGAGSTDERIAAMVDEPFPETEDGRNRRLRVRLFRMLLDDPVVYYDALGPEELAYLSKQRPFILREIESATPLVAEVRKEGIAMAATDADCTDLTMLEEGTDGHLTLLLAEHLASRLRGGRPEPLPVTELERHTAALIREHKSHWRKDVTESGAARLLTRDAVSRLLALRLIDVDAGGQSVRPLPAVGRYAVKAAREEGAGRNEDSLW